jgi:hypothetical protein
MGEASLYCRAQAFDEHREDTRFASEGFQRGPIACEPVGPSLRRECVKASQQCGKGHIWQVAVELPEDDGSTPPLAGSQPGGFECLTQALDASAHVAEQTLRPLHAGLRPRSWSRQMTGGRGKGGPLA